MAQPLPIPPAGFDDLPPSEKLHYVTALWDRIAESEESLPITDEQREFLRERIAAHQANPERAKPWSEVRGDIESEIRSRTGR